AAGELAAQLHIEYGLPDVLSRDRDQYAGRHTLVVGSGHSAATSVVTLAELARQVPDTWITWITRPRVVVANDSETAKESSASRGPIAEVSGDRLAERERIARTANALTRGDAEHVTYWGETVVESILWKADLSRFALRLAGRHAGELEVDRVIA